MIARRARARWSPSKAVSFCPAVTTSCRPFLRKRRRNECIDGANRSGIFVAMNAQNATLKFIRSIRPRNSSLPTLQSPWYTCQTPKSRVFSSSTKRFQQQPGYKDSFNTRLRRALAETKIRWYPIPVGVGIAFLGLGQFYRVREREKARQREEDDNYTKFTAGREGGDLDREGKPKKRARIRPTGPWCVSKYRSDGQLLTLELGRFRSCQHCH